MIGQQTKRKISAVFLCQCILVLIFVIAWFGISSNALADETMEGKTAVVITSGGEEVYYDTLQDAVKNVGNKETIKLLKDTTENITSGGKSYTLKMEKHSIDGNGAGTVYTISGGTVTLENGKLTNGVAGEYDSGGGLNITGTANITLNGMTITGNSAQKGGAIYFDGKGDLTIIDSTISENAASYQGGGLYAVGNAQSIWDLPDVVNVTLNGVKFEDNYTTSSSSSGGSALCLSRVTGAKATKCDFTDNYGDNAVGSSVITIEEDVIGANGVFSFNNCTVKGSYDCEHTIYIEGCDERYADWEELYATVTFDGCVISDNKAYYTGGIRINDYGVVTLKNTIIKGNKAEGEDGGDIYPVVGGVFCYNTTKATITFESGAIYDNIAENGDANDLYLGYLATTNIIPASEMTDENAEAGIELDEYVWHLPDGTFINEKMTDRYVYKNYDSDISLTAAHAPYPPAAEYKGVSYETIEAAIEAAKKDGKYPAEIKLLPGLDNFVEGIFSFSAATVNIDVPVILDLNKLTLSATGDTLFVVTEEGSLTLQGEGVLSGLIKIQNNSDLTLNTETDNKFEIKLEDEDAVITLGDDFASGSTISVELDEVRAAALNDNNYGNEDISYTIIKNGAKLELAQLSVALTNPRVKIRLNDDGDIIAVNASIKNALYVSSGGTDAIADGTSDDPILTVEEAIARLRGKPAGEEYTIYILDTVTIEDSGVEWDGGNKKITIVRSSKDGAPTNDDGQIDLRRAHMINIAGGASLTLKNITIDGESGSSNSPYYRAGSMITVEPDGELTLGENSVLQNNDVSVNYLDGTEEDPDTRILSNFCGGAVYVEGGTVNILPDSTIQNCTARLGGGIYCDDGSIQMSGGLITNNVAGTGFDLYSASGGGICLTGDNAVMNLSGGTFAYNEASDGGGVAVGTGGYSEDIRSNTNIPAFVMSDGSFIGNVAKGNGGGLFVQSTYRADVTKGVFSENECYDNHFGGGAIYVNGGKAGVRDGELWLKNVLITENYAKHFGGGIAGCYTSGSVVNMTYGSVIYHNYAYCTIDETEEYILCDISTVTSDTRVDLFEDTDLDHKKQQTRDYFTQYMVDGTPYHWKAAVEANGFKRGDYVSEDYLDSMTGKVVYTEADPNPETVDGMSVIISNNISNNGSGGGIGTNGSVFIGGETYKPSWEWDEIKPSEFCVEKKWEDLDKNDNGYPINLAQLNIWIITITDNGDGTQTINKIHNPMMVDSEWIGETRFEVLDENSTAIMLEEAIYNDGRHVWASLDQDYADYKDIIDDIIDDVMETMYADAECVLPGDSENAPFTCEYEENGGDFVVTNKPYYGDLEVSKTVEGNKGDTDKVFNFTVTLNDKSINGTYGDMTFNSGVATFTLTGGDSLTAENLPAGVKYTVTETEANQGGYITNSVGAEGKIPAKKSDETKPAAASFTNTRNGDTITINKTWLGRDTANHPESVTVQIYKDNVPYETVTLDEENNWSCEWTYIWTELQEQHEWRVEEVGVPAGYRVDYDHTDNDWTVKNIKLTDVSVEKVWEERTGHPTSVSVQLYQNGTAYGAPVTLDESNEWKYTWNNLDEDYDWTVDEVETPAGYRKTKDHIGNNWTITNIKQTEVSVEKIWDDDNSADRPASVSVQLYKDGVEYGSPETLNASNQWKHTWNNLDEDHDWTVDEVAVPTGYRKEKGHTGNDWTITNIKLVDVSVSKAWVGKDGTNHPNEVYVQLYCDGYENGEFVALSEANNWSHTWTGLEKDHVWTVKEIRIPTGYRMSIDHIGNDWTVTNIKQTDVSVEKVWVGGTDHPTSVSVQLYQDGVEYGEPVTLDESNEWKHVWNKLDENHNWTVDEVEVPAGYRKTKDHIGNNWTITNIKLTDVSVEKAWVGGTDHPESVSVQLYQDGAEYGAPVTLDDSNKWKHVWNNLDENHNWTVDEVEVPTGYRKTKDHIGNDWTITNIKQTDVSVEKVWVGGTDHPASVSVQLYQDGVEYGAPVTLDESNEWKHVWNKLDENHNWTVDEVETPTGYRKTKDHTGNDWTVTNIKLTDVSVEKIWVGGTDHPTSVSVQLYQDGVEYGEPVTLDESNEWKYVWNNLDENHNWTVDEVEVPAGYRKTKDHTGNDWTITNIKDEEPDIPEPELIDVTVNKVWEDDNSVDRPDSVTVQLYQDGKAYGDTVTLNKDNGWSHIWSELEKAHDWTVDEVNVPDGYHVSVSNDGNAWTIINTKDKVPYTPEPAPELIDVTVNKVWDDDNSADRPESVTVQLYRDGKAYGDAVTLNKENGWSHIWSELEKAHDWTVDEVNVPDGYHVSVSNDGNDWTITNIKDEEPTPEPEPVLELIDVTVNKVWDDDNSADRPTSVTVQLYQDGKAYGDVITLNENNGWSYTWSGLEKAHDWTVDEVNVPDGYEATVANSGNVWTITNTADETNSSVAGGGHDNDRDDETPPETGVNTRADQMAAVMLSALAVMLAAFISGKKLIAGKNK
ncbi:MAG: Cna B-type domain-containing protein [Eubacterium sp.]|nr:Cna B-type domain-containing protein [Eubacterium sp.]